MPSFPSIDPARIYVIGDIHGRSDLLDRMVEAIGRDRESNPTGDCLTVTVGDYIDRGADSRGVVERLAGNPFAMPYIALRGNHEQLLADFLNNPEVADDWRRCGGLETLHSYGVDVASVMRGRNYAAAARALRERLPQTHAEFFGSLTLSLQVGRYFLCHAGVRPGVALQRQAEDDLLWIRDEFLASRADFGKIVVHGHTPCAEPEVLSNRINVDTGAFMTNRLTCAVLEAERVRFLAVSL